MSAADRRIAEGAAALLEHLSEHQPDHERSATQRVLAEVLRAWPGDVDELWWRWFSEAAKSLGLRCKTLDCRVDQAAELVRDGGTIVTHLDGEEREWLLAERASNRKCTLVRAGESTHREKSSYGKLRSRIAPAATDGVVRCIVLQPHVTSDAHAGAREHLPPLERLRKLLRPEWSDIWVVVIFAFVVGLLMLATPVAVEALVNTVAFGRFLQPIVVLALILLLFLGFQAAVRALQTYVVEIIQRRLFARVAGDLAFRLPRTETAAMDGKYAPELVNRFFDIVTVQKVSAQILLDGIGLVLSTFIGMAVLGFYHPWLLGFDVLLLACISFVVLVLGRGAVASAIRESKHKYEMASWLEDVARCPNTFRSDGGAELSLERADRLVHQYLSARKSHFRVLMRQIVFALGLQAIASTVLLGLGGWLVVSQELTLGQLVAAELIVTMIVGNFAKFGKHIESFYDLLASIDKLGTLIDLQAEREDGIIGTGSQTPITVELGSVSYRRPGRRPTLDAVHAEIAAASNVVIYGPSASGKSTLCDLIYGLRAPSNGHIALNGFDPRDLRPDVLRSRVGMARGAEVFQGTIEENVHLHRPHVSAANVRDALDCVGLLDPVLRFDDGLDSRVPSDGGPLTENQRRLLGLARAFVGRPGLLIIDGVLDSLSDEELETVLAFLTAPDRPWTLIVTTGRDEIAKRFSSRIDLHSPPVNRIAAEMT